MCYDVSKVKHSAFFIRKVNLLILGRLKQRIHLFKYFFTIELKCMEGTEWMLRSTVQHDRSQTSQYWRAYPVHRLNGQLLILNGFRPCNIWLYYAFPTLLGLLAYKAKQSCSMIEYRQSGSHSNTNEIHEGMPEEDMIDLFCAVFIHKKEINKYIGLLRKRWHG